jgi:hypothetical protein
MTRVLAQAGHLVVAVEPHASMRELLRAGLGSAADVPAGSAESIPLGDEAADAVVAAESYHWFDEQVALREITQVVSPGGHADDRVAHTRRGCSVGQGPDGDARPDSLPPGGGHPHTAVGTVVHRRGGNNLPAPPSARLRPPCRIGRHVQLRGPESPTAQGPDGCRVACASASRSGRSHHVRTSLHRPGDPSGEGPRRPGIDRPRPLRTGVVRALRRPAGGLCRRLSEAACAWSLGHEGPFVEPVHVVRAR